MKKIILLFSLLTLIAFVSGALAEQKTAPAKPATTFAPAPAPSAPEKAKVEKLSGTIEKVDEVAKSIVVKRKKEEKTFVTDDNTKITKAGKDMSFGDLKKGANVSVEYKKDGEKMLATAIKVSAHKK